MDILKKYQRVFDIGLKANYKYPKQSRYQDKPNLSPFQLEWRGDAVSSRIFQSFEGKRLFLYSAYVTCDNPDTDIELANHTLIILGAGNGDKVIKQYNRSQTEPFVIESQAPLVFDNAIAFISSVALVNAVVLLKGEIET